jgi:hypothetical protein
MFEQKKEILKLEKKKLSENAIYLFIVLISKSYKIKENQKKKIIRI